jgi:hypothetical protein
LLKVYGLKDYHYIYVQDLIFLSKGKFHKRILPNLVEKTTQFYVLPNLTKCYITIVSFDLCMSKGVHDIFALVVIFYGFD